MEEERLPSALLLLLRIVLSREDELPHRMRDLHTALPDSREVQALVAARSLLREARAAYGALGQKQQQEQQQEQGERADAGAAAALQLRREEVAILMSVERLLQHREAEATSAAAAAGGDVLL